MDYHVEFPGMGLAFDISPQAFTIGTFSVYWYGIIIGAGFILAVAYCMRQCKRHDVDPDKLLNCVIAGLVCAIIGARLYFVLFSWDSYKGDLLKIVNIHSGGLAIYGGLIGALAGGLTTAKIQKMKLMPILDITVRGFLIGQGIGRWGNFMNQEAFGTQTDLPWRMVSEATGGVGVHPCFLYESVWCLLGFVLLHIISRKGLKFDGQLFYMYLFWYGLERTVVEGLRTDSLLIPGTSVRVSQILSLLLVITGAAMTVIMMQKCRTRAASEKTEEKE